MILQVGRSADEMHARSVHVETVVQPAGVSSARLAAWRLLTETRSANIQVPASVAGFQFKHLPFFSLRMRVCFDN